MTLGLLACRGHSIRRGQPLIVPLFSSNLFREMSNIESDIQASIIDRLMFEDEGAS
jgi:hypothetical protein